MRVHRVAPVRRWSTTVCGMTVGQVEDAGDQITANKAKVTCQDCAEVTS